MVQTINIEDLKLSQLRKSDLKTLVGWAKKEGWNPGEQDYDIFWKTDPDGFYGFFYEDALIAGGSVVSYNDEFGFMGLFIVHPDFRDQGIGRKLWYLRRNLLLERLKDGVAIGMDGVVAMQPFYARGGFKMAFKDERYECMGQKLSYSDAISTIEDEDFEQILAYDLLSLGYNRQRFLKNWLLNPDSLSFKYLTENGLSGYATIRKADHGYKIGPLFADSDEIAEDLYRACLNWAEGEAVFLDIPMINKGAIALVEKYEATYVFECARMYLGKPTNMEMDKVYGITTFELG